MPQQHAAELCSLLVNDIYGEVSSRVVGVLLEFGRLPANALSRHAKLPEKIVKQTLVVLIQQHLVLHYTHNENGKDFVYYECDWMQVYELLHAGRIIRATEDRFGNDGALIISNMLQLGHAKVSEFIAAYGISTKKSRQSKFDNPPADDKSTIIEDNSSAEDLKTVMASMLKEHFLIEVQEHHMHPRTDTINKIRIHLTSMLRKDFTTEIKLVKEVERKMQEKLKEMADGDTSEHAGLKRKFAGASGKGRKRVKVSNGDDGSEIEWEIDQNIVLRVNHEKFLVLFRNAELVSIAEKRLGKVTAQVYAEFLRRLEGKYRRCRNIIPDEDEEEDPKKKIKLSALELSRTFNKDIDLENSIAAIQKPANTNRKRNRDDYDDDDDDDEPRGKGNKRNQNYDDDEEDDEVDEWAEDADNDADIDHSSSAKKRRMELIKQHLELLAEDSYRFLKHESNRGLGEWSVNYKELGKLMKLIEMEKVVEDKFGPVATRLMRIIKEKGKLDEKQIATIALLKQKEIRSTLSGLQESGYLELQEVPKSLPPQVSRTYFLWYYDFDRAVKALISDLYKAMSRCIQRTNQERSERSTILEKWERTDVQENPEEYLTKDERRKLEHWRNIEEKLLVQLMRLDRMVMILRDF